MSGLKLIPLSQVEPAALADLMEAEEHAWRSQLDWDYSPVRRILASFFEQRLLPGFAALSQGRVVGYTYFLIQRQRGIIGTLYVAVPEYAQEVAEEILGLAITRLKESDELRRIEAQIIPLVPVDLASIFVRYGFRRYGRYYLELDLARNRPQPGPADFAIVKWNPAHLQLAADVTARSYKSAVDALICEDYGSARGCETYLRSLIENPGCGTFCPDASFTALDERGLPCGFIIASRLSDQTGMIPQISLLPSYQGRGVGRALMARSLTQLQTLGFRRVSLAVTEENTRAYAWYRRLGFEPRKEFGAYVWEREPASEVRPAS